MTAVDQLPASQQEPGTTVTLLQDAEGALVRRTVLPGGLRIITEHMPGCRSVSFGAGVGAGSRDEQPHQHGAAHYLEHLLFKATARRNAFEISAAIDAVGGEMNAFTSREATTYYARVLGGDLPIAVDVVLDVVAEALMRDQDVEAERHVVLEEIAMHEDDPSDVAHERFFTGVLPDHALARPVLGTTASIEELAPQTIRDFYRKHYRPEGIVVCAAGAVEHDEVVALVRGAADRVGWCAGSAGPVPLRAAAGLAPRPPQADVLRRPSEQVHLVIGGPALARNDPDKYVLAVLNTVLGGGMSARLFHRVREERGLAYSVYSFTSAYADCGLFGVYAGSMPKKADEAADVIRAELAAVAAAGLTAAEVARGKGAVRGAILLGLEDPFSRMSRLGQSELTVGELPTIDEVHRRIDAVSVDDVARVAAQVLGAATHTTVVGPVPAGRTVGRNGGAA
jgi:predicted Zn-dependent peptidase